MKKYLKIILPITFIGILLVLGYQIVLKINHKNEIAQSIKNIPEFSYQDIKGRLFTNKNLKKETATIFIYFNTECGFCTEEAQMIKENIERLKNFQLIFVSFEKLENITAFAQKHQLTIYDNIVFLCDNKNTFASTFDVSGLPCLILYDKEQNFIEKIKGQTTVEILVRKMNAK
jgi:peroxiredoxin